MSKLAGKELRSLYIDSFVSNSHWKRVHKSLPVWECIFGVDSYHQMVPFHASLIKSMLQKGQTLTNSPMVQSSRTFSWMRPALLSPYLSRQWSMAVRDACFLFEISRSWAHASKKADWKLYACQMLYSLAL